MAGQDDKDNTEIKIHKIHVTADVVSKAISDVFKWGTLIFIVYTGGEVLLAYSGKTTIADINFSWIMNEHLANFLGLIFGVGGILYGRKQSKLRKDAIENLHPNLVAAQQEVDPGRSSSGLTTRGDTRDGDS